jgi:hypothetical protein
VEIGQAGRRAAPRPDRDAADDHGGHGEGADAERDLGLYPIVTFQYSSPLYTSFPIIFGSFFSFESDNRISP